MIILTYVFETLELYEIVVLYQLLYQNFTQFSFSVHPVSNDTSCSAANSSTIETVKPTPTHSSSTTIRIESPGTDATTYFPPNPSTLETVKPTPSPSFSTTTDTVNLGTSDTTVSPTSSNPTVETEKTTSTDPKSTTTGTVDPGTSIDTTSTPTSARPSTTGTGQ